MNKKRLAINMTAQLISFAVSMGVNFVLSPYIVAQVGDVAMSYVKMSNDFVAYAQILVSALNTMASRFITINIHQGKYEEANKYFTSVFYSNILISLVLLLPSAGLIVFLDRILNIEAVMLTDVQILFLFIFINFFINIIASIFSVATYAMDRLDLTAIKTIQTEIIRAVILVGAYVFFRPYLWYIGLASVICTLFMAFANRRFTKRLLPDIQVDRKHFDIKKIWELVSLGLWNSVTRLGQALLEQVDLIIANLFVYDSSGVLAIAKTLPSTVTNLMGSVVGIFNPQITIAYANGDTEQLINIIKSSNRILIFMLSIPLAFLTAYGKEFYILWQPTLDAEVLYRLTILTVGTLYVSVSIQVLYHVFIITKKVKENSIVMLGSGVLSTAIVLALLNLTDLGVYAVAGVSTAIGLVRNLTFTPVYAARSLGVKWYRFYSDIGLGLVSIGVIIALGLCSKQLLAVTSWGTLFGIGIPTGLAAVAVNYFIILTRQERAMINRMVKKILGR